VNISFEPILLVCPINEVFSLLSGGSGDDADSMVMPSLKSGCGAARRRFWLAMSGFVMALALMPFSYKVERRLETVAHIKAENPKS